MISFYYKGFDGCKSFCGLDIIKTGTDIVTVIFTELFGNPGTPVANFIEQLATILYDSQLRYLKIPATNIMWIQYRPQGLSAEGQPIAEAYDQVIFEWDGLRFRSPRLVHIPKEKWNEYHLI